MKGNIVGVAVWRELLCVLWFTLTAFAFYAPVWGITLPMGGLTALYGLILLMSVATLALSLVDQKGKKKRVE